MKNHTESPIDDVLDRIYMKNHTESPIDDIQMGGSVAEAVFQFFKAHTLDSKIVLMSGISAGFGAAFGTPITGAIFGMEMAALGKIKFEAFVPCVVASFVGHYETEGVWVVYQKTPPASRFITIA